MSSHIAELAIQSGSLRPPIRALVRRWFRESHAQDLIEYAILAAFIGLAAYGAMPRLSASLDSWYSVIGDFIGGGEEPSDEGGGTGKTSNCSATGMAKSKGKCHGA